MATTTSRVSAVRGHVSRGFEAVEEAFDANFVRRQELGGACCVYVGGERSLTSGEESERRRPATPGNGTRWSSSIRRRRA
jgi:hypothetical protein